MSVCQNLRLYFDRRLEPESLRRFQEHLGECESCGAATTEWQFVRLAIQSHAALTKIDQPTLAKAARLIECVNQIGVAKIESPPVTFWAGAKRHLIAAAAVLAVAGLAILALNSDLESVFFGDQARPKIEAEMLLPGQLSPIAFDASASTPIEAVTGGCVVVQIGQSWFTLMSDSRATVTEVTADRTRVVLERGQMVCAFEPRREREIFIVETDNYAVQVIGTRFSVGLRGTGQFEVVVAEGQVDVQSDDDTTWRVGETQTLVAQSDGNVSLGPASKRAVAEIGHILENWRSASTRDAGAEIDDDAQAAKSTAIRHKKNTNSSLNLPVGFWFVPQSDEQREWLEQIRDGRYASVADQIEAYLELTARDVHAWMLLAECQVALGRHWAAVKSFEYAASNGTSAQASRALYMAAVVLQDELGEHARAKQKFHSYLEFGRRHSPLRAHALYRLSQIEIELGNTTEAQRHLEWIVNNRSGSPIAHQASRLLDSLRPKKNPV